MAIGTTVKVGWDATKVNRGLRDIKSQIGGLAKTTAKWAGAAVAAAGAFAAFQTIRFLKDSSRVAADFESMQMSFKVLLGSMDKAKKRMAELKQFSTVTPFEPKEIIRASKLLQTIGGDMMATGDGLRMVGDAAAVAGAPLEEVALHVGRVFGALTSGTTAGESVNRMQELGLISGDLKRKLQEMGQAMSAGRAPALSQAEAMQLLAEALKRTEGAMAELSGTTAGKISTLRGNVDLLKEAFGTGLNEGIVAGIDKANEALPELIEMFTSWGKLAGTYISEGLAGNTEPIEEVFLYLGSRLREILDGAMVSGLVTGGQNLTKLMGPLNPASITEKLYPEATDYLNQPGTIQGAARGTRGSEVHLARIAAFAAETALNTARAAEEARKANENEDTGGDTMYYPLSSIGGGAAFP